MFLLNGLTRGADGLDMRRATDAEIELFHAFLEEEDPRVANLMAHILGIADACDVIVDLTEAPEEQEELREPAPHVCTS